MSQSRRASFPHSQTRQLRQHAQRHQHLDIQNLLSSEPDRLADFVVCAAGLRLDYSRHLLDARARSGLLQLAGASGLEQARQALFSGARINQTEDRAALHTLLRCSESPAGLEQEFAEVQRCRSSMQEWVDRVRGGSHRGFTGQPISDVVNLGIGGSDLGPRMVCEALAPLHQGGPRTHFCANIDPSDLEATLTGLNPATTLFIICSKSFTTEETRHNAQSARRWLLAAGANAAAISQHFLAVSTNLEAASEFGIAEENILPLWDWVGGRYSLWSAIGWSIAFAVGNNAFAELLSGARQMDQHFQSAPLHLNMPVVLSLLEIWYVDFMAAQTHAVIPYHHNLRRLPAFLQQLSMESNGKTVNREGETLDYATNPVVWGDEGSNGQHSFHQLLHQGSVLCPVDFILPLRGCGADKDGQKRLVAHCLAQGQALMQGRDRRESTEELLLRGLDQTSAEMLAPHLVIPGNRPSSTISFGYLDPETLGALLALYEHKTFCSGHFWNINSFDQWGVELGKALSSNIYKAMNGEDVPLDASTGALLQAWRDSQGEH
jgi:glucose-6-phosphate isomerase